MYVCVYMFVCVYVRIHQVYLHIYTVYICVCTLACTYLLQILACVAPEFVLKFGLPGARAASRKSIDLSVILLTLRTYMSAHT